MEVIEKPSDILSEFCKIKKCWGMVLAYYGEDHLLEEVHKAVPYLSVEQVMSLMIENCIFIFFKSEDVMRSTYNNTIGDDGPVEGFNSYSGPVTVYALTCDPHGEFRNENT